MSTTQQDKSTGKQRQRNRKADQRNRKSEQQAALRPDQDEARPIETPAAEAELVEAEPVAMAAAEEMIEEVTEEATEMATRAEVLVPDVRDATPPLNAVNLQTVAQAYGDYSRKSWQTSRFLVERLMTARSFDEATEIQGEFAKQAYANFLAQSQKVCELYGDLAKQFFKPLDKFTTPWTRPGR